MDLLIRNCTRIDPVERLGIDDFIKELEILIKNPDKRLNFTPMKLKDIVKKISDYDQKNKNQMQDIEVQKTQINDLVIFTNALLNELKLKNELSEFWLNSPDFVHDHYNSKFIGAKYPFGEKFTSLIQTRVGNEETGFKYFSAGVGFKLLPLEKVEIFGVICFNDNQGVLTRWNKSRIESCGTLSSKEFVKELIEEIIGKFENELEEFHKWATSRSLF